MLDCYSGRVSLKRSRMMRKIFFVSFLSAFLFIALTTFTYALPPYTIQVIGSNAFRNTTPQINDNGFVVWDAMSEIFLYDGSTTHQITNNSYDDHYPQINNKGSVVWQGYPVGDSPEIFLYDGSITQITNGKYAEYGRINDYGLVTWQAGSGRSDIFLYDGLTATKLNADISNNTNSEINNSGHVAWQGIAADSWEIFLYDGSMTRQITDSDEQDYAPKINDNGDIVWRGYDGYEIMLYDGSITRLTNNVYFDEYPQINDNKNVVWQRNDGHDSEIFLYDGSSVHQLTDNLYDDIYPQINNSGLVTWTGNGEVFLYDGNDINQLTFSSSDAIFPVINERGDIAWRSRSNGEILIATPIPEPSSILLLSFGLLGAGLLKRRNP